MTGLKRDSTISVIASGCKNISTGMDNCIILFNPKFAITKETSVNTMAYFL